MTDVPVWVFLHSKRLWVVFAQLLFLEVMVQTGHSFISSAKTAGFWLLTVVCDTQQTGCEVGRIRRGEQWSRRRRRRREAALLRSGTRSCGASVPAVPARPELRSRRHRLSPAEKSRFHRVIIEYFPNLEQDSFFACIGCSSMPGTLFCYRAFTLYFVRTCWGVRACVRVWWDQFEWSRSSCFLVNADARNGFDDGRELLIVEL